MTKRKQYKKLIKRQKENHKDNIIKQLSSNTHDPSTFWKLLDTLRNADIENSSPAENIPITDWTSHFKGISLKSEKHNTNTLLPLITQLEKEAANNLSHILNQPFTISEIKSVIKNLKNNKSSGIDMITNEMLKNGQSILLPAICKLFNTVFNSKCFPTKWNISAITPIHKKGCNFNPDNYRGISITSCLGKCFTSVLSNRLIKYIDDNNIISDHQAAFRKSSRTSDHMFVLKSLLNKYTSKKKGKLYTCFVDFRKAFDSVWREALLYKILKLGIRGNFYWILKYMYTNSFSCVKLPQGLSEQFNTELGIRQGDCLSPILFNLFINDIGAMFNKHCDPVTLGTFTFNHLLYADDLVLVSETKEGLQSCLNKLNKYTNTWNLEINIAKTNVVIFHKFGRRNNPKFYMGKNELSCSNTYSYLGIEYDSNCNFKKAATNLRSKASKATFSLLSALTSNNTRDVKLYIQLFDKLIKPIATYASEIWLPNQFYKMLISTNRNFDSLPYERLQQMFYKYILNINKSTSNKNIRKELGRLPLIYCCLIKTLKYWSHILSKPQSSLLYQSYLSEIEYNSDWVKSVKYILKICKLDHFWNMQNPIDDTIINTYVKPHLKDFFKIYDASNDDLLIQHTPTYRPVNYLSHNIPIYSRNLIAKLRLRSNKLEIVRGKYSRPSVNKENRICKSCNMYMDDETHFLIQCQSLSKIREELFAKIIDLYPDFTYVDSKQKTIYLLNPQKVETSIALSDFIHKAKQLRNF
jgi:hypothetical protein